LEEFIWFADVWRVRLTRREVPMRSLSLGREELRDWIWLAGIQEWGGDFVEGVDFVRVGGGGVEAGKETRRGGNMWEE
jgi:hypothetical protein